MRFAANGLCQAHAKCQNDAQTDWHIHIDPAIANGAKGGSIKRQSGIGRRRQRDQGRYPVKQIAGRPAHALKISGPDRDRQQHHVPGCKPGNRQTAQQFLVARCCCLFKGGRIKRDQAIAHLHHRANDVFDIGNIALPAQAQAACRHIDAGLQYGTVSVQQGFDQPDTGRTMNAIDHQVQMMMTVGIGAGQFGEIKACDFVFVRAKGPDLGIDCTSVVIGCQPHFAQ